jgi:predicted O-methyltransferase YrrM
MSAWLAGRVAPGGRAVAVDLDLSLVGADVPGLELRRADILAGPVEPGDFDLVTARAGLAAGTASLDVGCGDGQVTVAMARLAGPRGLAVGMDVDADALAIAQAAAARGGVRARFVRAMRRAWARLGRSTWYTRGWC